MAEEKNGKDQINLTVTADISRRFRQMCLDDRVKMNEQFEALIEREWNRRAELVSAEPHGKRNAKA